MDIIENWSLLNSRMKEKKPALIKSLMPIHMGAFEDLRKSGHMLLVNDKPVSEVAPTLEPQQRLILAGNIGRSLIQAQGDTFDKRFSIKLADHFPHCIFIALAAILENLDGGFDVLYPDKKMAVVCEYETTSGNNDPLGKILPVIGECFPWVALSTEVRETAPRAKQAPRSIPKEKSSLVFTTEQVTRLDTMRTVFAGTIQRGTIRKGEVLNVIDSSGTVLCREGMVLSIFANGGELDKAEEKQHIDEMCLAVEIPGGSYSGIFLVDGDKTLASSDQTADAGSGKSTNQTESTDSAQQNTNKKSFWSRLLKK